MLAAGVGGASDGDLIVSVAENQCGEVRLADYAPALIAAGGGKPGSGYSAVLIRTPGGETRVRRLTPREYERLQGFPDDGTAGQSDHTRYAQMGNAVCVKVVAWLAQRLMASLVAQEAPAAAGQVAR